MTVEMSVRITLALYITFYYFVRKILSYIYNYICILNPSAGIGRQDKLKLY